MLLRSELCEMDYPLSLASVKRFRARLGLRCHHKRRFVRTTKGNHTLPIAPNLLDPKFDQTSAPNQIWVSDITYIHTDESWLYVAAIKGLFTKKIVG
jgi:putative transposase